MRFGFWLIAGSALLLIVLALASCGPRDPQPAHYPAFTVAEA